MTRPVLLYDADCRFCRFAARAVRRLDRHERLALLSLTDEEATPLLASVPAEERLNSLRLAEPDGCLLARGAAVKAVLAQLGVRSAGLERAYGFVASRRGSLGRLVPDGSAPRRYP
ncbi:MAG TPA: DCC1-like thiol-disulfide oxidoreductase family protein [Gaiellaceae bacterium]|nr:DCC1-like thiol-disulfide oxidoreductase family protein [Gaiellaceae bacterium]